MAGKGSEPRETIFNSAAASLERLHTCLVESAYYASRCKYKGYHPDLLMLWRDVIWNVYREVSSKLYKGKYQKDAIAIKTLNDISKLWKHYKEVGKIQKSERTQHGMNTIIDTANFDKKWMILSKIEISLRIYADYKGMLIPDKPKQNDMYEDFT